ncbi:MAG: PDZ domain-containing protein [Fuerstiella sp.]
MNFIPRNTWLSGLSVLCCLLSSVASFSSPAFSNSAFADPIEYRITFQDAANHYINVAMTINDVDGDDTTLMMPTWTPGSYLMREYARNIDGITAVDANGSPLNLNKQTRNRWQIEGQANGKIVVTYRLYCHEMSVRTNWVDSDLAILTGAATFLTVPERRNQVHAVTLELPAAWKQAVSSLTETVPGSSWSAMTFEQLVDNPIIAGNPVSKNFEAGGRPHQLVSLGDTSLWELDKATGDVQKIVAEHQRMFRGVPYDDYKFLNMITEGRGGLEHDNCTLLMTSRWNFRDEDKYEDWLSLVSHEFFHTWNVRRLRPAGIWQYNLEKENYTPSLWIAEGITSYYEDVALVRAGLIDQNAYLKRLSKTIKTLQTANGRQVQSLTDSSHDTWIKFYRPDENSKNSRVSYYTKGAVVGFLLDAKIKQATDGQKNLDHVMRSMFHKFAGKQGYSEQDFRNEATAVAGVDLSDWFAATIDSTDELNYQPALNYYGLAFDNKDEKEATADSKSKKLDQPTQDADATAKQAKADDKDGEKDEPEIDAGITFSSSNENPTISGIRSNSAAFQAGLNVGDEVIAVNGYRTSKAKWDSQLIAFAKEKSVQLSVARRGKMKLFQLQLEEASKDVWKLKVAAKASSKQKARVNSWLRLTDEN